MIQFTDIAKTTSPPLASVSLSDRARTRGIAIINARALAEASPTRLPISLKYPDGYKEHRRRRLKAYRPPAPVTPPEPTPVITPEPLWPECDPSRIYLPDGTRVSVYSQYVKEGVKSPHMGEWFNFDTFGHALVISLDTEYQADVMPPDRETDDDDSIPHIVNDIVSYQMLAVSEEGRAVEAIFYCDTGIRIALTELIEAARRLLGLKPKQLRAASKHMRHKVPAQVLLLSHFGAAEWAALRDREKLGEILQIIRKAPVSLGTVAYKVKMNNRTVECGLTVADTTLIAPAGKGRLAALGDVVGVPKLELPHGAIKRMRGFMQEDPKMFADYGVNDCRITYAYYAKMHSLAKGRIGLPKMPLTLGGFGVEGYREYTGAEGLNRLLGLIKVPGYRRTQIEKTLSRQVADAFFAPAFSGGLNVAIQGEFTNTLVVDLDFASCYPSAAASLPALTWERDRSVEDPREICDILLDTLNQYQTSTIAL